MDIKEEGEISLDDVSSSEETNHNNWLKRGKKIDMDRKYEKRVEVDILPQDAVYGKENRRYSNELHTQDIKIKPPVPNDLSKDGLLPISSDEHEVVGDPMTSVRMMIPLGPKRKRKKKKKKKKTGQRMLVLDDLESGIEVPSAPTRITGDDNLTPPIYYESSELHKKYSPPSTKLYRSPVDHYKPITHHPHTLSPRRRSPRRLSPERLNGISDRHSQYKSSREHLSRRDQMQILKRVREFNNRYKETPIKDKSLNKAHVFKSEFDSNLQENGNLDNHRVIYDVEDEEDVDKLRRAALETKLQKSERKDIEIMKDSKTESEDNSSLNYNAGDQDEEDLELRMIALRSAFQKKHRDRVQRGVVGRNKNIDRDDKSSSSDSFIDDIYSYYNDDKETTTATGVDVEDMDLDSDVEREKENQPYSPTDGLSDDKYSDTETLGPTNRIPSNSHPTIAPTAPRVVYSAPVPTYSQKFYPQPNRMAHPESAYPPSDFVQPPTVDRYLDADQFNYNCSYLRPMPPRIGAVATSSHAETPYSPTDTPSFDPELPVCPSELSFADNITNTTSVPYSNNTYLNNLMLGRHNSGSNYIPPPPELNKPTAPSLPQHLSRDPRRAAALSRGVIPVPSQPQKTTPTKQSLVKPVEKSKEAVSADPRIHGIFAASKPQNDERFDEIMKSLEEYTSEPAYLQGVPQVTKDANKIPTLVNRTLVPAPILKTNKQLQQKLPAKKPDDAAEKTFKNAEMQPVEIGNQSKPISTFKPIKIPSKTRKIQLIDIPTKGFNSITESSTSANKTSENSGAVDLNKNSETSTTEGEVKKKGRRPKTPTIRKPTAKKSPVKDSSKASTKSTGRRPKENNKEVTNSAERKEKVNEGETKRPRGRPKSKSVHRTDENEEENKKRESIHRTAKEKTSKENDKKRRSSADEDEEALRASVIASMYTSGLKKIRDDSTDKTKLNSTKDKSSIASNALNEKSTTPTVKNNSTLINNVNNIHINNKNPTARNIAGNAASNVLVNARKRPGTADVFGPPEKILKKTTIISKNPYDNLTKNLAAPASPKMSKNVSRVVINLGEDTDSDSDSSNYSSLSSSKKANVPSVSLSDFDKRVDEFLKSQREKLEVNSKVPSTHTGNKTSASTTSVLGSTPLAVRHLPVSKQEEYRRLKQQLAEKEKQKLIRASEMNLQKSTKTVSKSAEESAQVTATNLQVKKTTRSSKSTDQEVFTNIPQSPKISSSLTPAAENLVSFTSIYPNNLINLPLAEEQELLLPLDFTIKPDPDDFLTITDELKVDPLIIESVSQNCGDEINYDMPLENLGMRENLIIQISNTQNDNMANQRKVLFAKDLSATEEITAHTLTVETPPSTPTAPVLKILTSAQLNMKIEQEPSSTNQEEVEEKVRLDESGQVIVQNTQPLIENTTESNSSANESISQVPLMIPKPEPVIDSSKQQNSVPSIQTPFATESSAITPTKVVEVNVNTGESASLLPPKKEPEVEPSIQTEPETPINIIKSKVEENLETYSKLPIEEQKTELSKIENDLVKKRYNVLSDITEMIECLQHWEAEQNARMKLASDAARLRLELKMTEERLEEQKRKVNNMGPKIRKTHSTINAGKLECVKLIRLCEGLGANVTGNEYKTPDTGADALTNKLRDITSYTQQLFKKKEAYNEQKNNEQLTPPTAHKNSIESNGVKNSSFSDQQSAPLNLSVQPTFEANENLPTFKVEEPENQDLNCTSITTPISNANSTSVTNYASVIASSSITDSASNNSPTLPVQPDLSINISQTQETSDEFSLSKVKAEPVDAHEIQDLEIIPMEVDNESERIENTKLAQVIEPIAQIKTERIDDEGINESISICNNIALKKEKDDIQLEKSSEDISINNLSIRVIPSERLISQRMEEEQIREKNVESTDKQQANTVNINDKTVELSFNMNQDVCKIEIPEIEKRLDDQIHNMEVESVSDTSLINGLGNNQIQSTEVKSETEPFSNKDLEESNINSVGQACERSAKAVAANTQGTCIDFEEEKPSLTGVPYESVLSAFNTIRPVDPNGVLCPFELMGTCKDDSCTYNHLNADRKT